jgi:hypothetical protein
MEEIRLKSKNSSTKENRYAPSGTPNCLVSFWMLFLFSVKTRLLALIMKTIHGASIANETAANGNQKPEK